MTTLPFYIPSAPLAASCPAGAEALPVGLTGLLNSLGWVGRPEQVAEAAGNLSAGLAGAPLDFERCCAAAQALGLELAVSQLRLAEALRLGRPGLFEAPGEPVCVLIPEEGGVTCLDPVSGATRPPPATARRGRFAQLAPAAQEGLARWRGLLRGAAGQALLLLGGLTLASNVLGMALPLFSMAVYDQVLAARDIALLPPLALGAALALGLDALLRLLRSVALGHLAARFELRAGLELLAALLRLPAELLDRTPPAAAAARLNEAQALRGFLFGPLALACLEMPFALLYLLLLAALSGWLVLGPLAVLLLGGALAWQLLRRGQGAARRQAEAAAAFQAVQREFSGLLPEIKARGQEPVWLERFRQASAAMAEAGLAEARLRGLAQNAAQGLTTLAAVTTLGAGAALAIHQTLSIGTLVAVMALVWRMLAPLSSALGAIARLAELRGAQRSLEALMALPPEPSAASRPSAANARLGSAGRLTLSQLVVTYPGAAAPALNGVSAELAAGQRVAVTGPGGGGKSTLLRLLCGLATPQMGAVLLDGMDLRQIAPATLRRSLALVAAEPPRLPLSLAALLRLGRPAAEEAALREACRQAGLAAALDALPLGLDTPCDTLPAGFQERLWLARLHLLPARVLLLDEPPCHDADSRAALLAELDRRRSESTVLLVTHQPELIEACDRVLVLQQGALAFDGTPRALAERLEASRR